MTPYFRLSSALLVLLPVLALISCETHTHDVIIENGMIHDGTGDKPQRGDIAVDGGMITHVGELPDDLSAPSVVDAEGKVVAPGFINMLNRDPEYLIEDGRSMSGIRQGVTLEVMGGGYTLAPINDRMAARIELQQTGIEHSFRWRSLGQFLDYMVASGVSPNIASYVGASSVRIHVMDHEDREPTSSQLNDMQQLVRESMQQGALGLSAEPNRAPGSYADTDELAALAESAGEYGGLYAAYLRNERAQVIEALEELLSISGQADTPAHVHQIKTAGPRYEEHFPPLLDRMDQAIEEGRVLSADTPLYTHTTGELVDLLPHWVMEGGMELAVERLINPGLQQQITEEMQDNPDGVHHLLQLIDAPEDVVLAGFRSGHLDTYRGMSLLELSELRETAPARTVTDLIQQDEYPIDVLFNLKTEEQIAELVSRPWIGFGSAAGSQAAEEPFLQHHAHPAAYGNTARLLNDFTGDEAPLSLQQAIHRLTGFAAERLGIRDRGRLQEGYHADIVLFDPKNIRHHADFDDPHRYAEGMDRVWVNGVLVLDGGEHTGETPGQAVRGPGWYPN